MRATQKGPDLIHPQEDGISLDACGVLDLARRLQFERQHWKVQTLGMIITCSMALWTCKTPWCPCFVTRYIARVAVQFFTWFVGGSLGASARASSVSSSTEPPLPEDSSCRGLKTRPRAAAARRCSSSRPCNAESFHSCLAAVL